MVTLHKQNYMEPRAAIESLTKGRGSYETAQSTLVEALSNGELRAIGYEVTTPTSATVKIWRPPLKELQPIPIQFWSLSTQDDIDKWNWQAGSFSCVSQGLFKYHASNEYRLVKFHKRDIESLVNLPGTKARSGRPMSPLWPEWVAELASAVHDGEIRQDMRQAHVRDLIAIRLANRNLEEPSNSITNLTIAAVLDRLRANANS